MCSLFTICLSDSFTTRLTSCLCIGPICFRTHDVFSVRVCLRCSGKFVEEICFTICLCISPDLDGSRGTTKMCPEKHTRYVSRYVCSLVRTYTGKGHPKQGTICFTICLFISPDLDGNRGTRKMCPGINDMFHDMFVLQDKEITISRSISILMHNFEAHCIASATCWFGLWLIGTQLQLGGEGKREGGGTD
jgi:hypothetical protein